MIRNLKILGLALVAVFALIALAASAASAQGKLTTSDGKPATLVGTETGVSGAGLNAWTAFGSKIECILGFGTGHQYNVTPHVPVPHGATTITITPHYKNCHTFIPETKPLTVTMNGCDWVVHIGATTGGVAGTYGGTADVVCPLGKNIEIHVYNSAAHTETLCTLTVTPRNGITGGHVTNTPASGDLDVQGTGTGTVVHREGLCLLDGQGTTTEAGQMHGDATVKSATAGQNISISDS
jgi:hypothetical protein